MKSLQSYIYENIKKLPNNVKGIIVFDIDDTLLKVDDNDVKIYKKEPGKKEIALTTVEFANDKDADDKNKQSWFDYRDFNDAEKVYKSIINSTPLIKNLRIMDDYINAGYEFCFLTTRACEDVIKNALDEILKIKTKDGKLKKLGDIFNKTMSHALNDTSRFYKGETNSEKKANVLADLCKKYDKVAFVDDNEKYLKAAKELQLPNLTIIKSF